MVQINRPVQGVNPFDLETIAANLEALEETIIFQLLDRSQFAYNQNVYKQGKSGFPKEIKRSLLELRLYYQEQMDSLFGRYSVPEERPFTKNLPAAKRFISTNYLGLPPMDFDCVNQTSKILSAYQCLLPKLCPTGDDKQYGSSVEHDVVALQAISRRIHYGAVFVAESKFRADPSNYSLWIKKRDRKAILTALTRIEVEQKILLRVKNKVDSIQQNVNQKVRRIIKPEIVISFYRDSIIPLTKEGEICYLLNRFSDAT